jgi:hypothetical protein
VENPLKIVLTTEGDATRAELSGEVTEDADFGPILSHPAAKLILSLENIKHLNSTGVREWLEFIKELGRQGRAVALDRCSVPIVRQLNMINNFRGVAAVESVFVPYFCKECDAEKTVLEALASPSAPLGSPLPCPDCAALMEFDDVPDTYFAFCQVKARG